MEQMIADLLEIHNLNTKNDVCHFMLESVVRSTKSEMAYVAFTNEDQSILTMYAWSKQAMKECQIVHKPITYYVDQTGLWGEPVRQKKAIITNNYEDSSLKKGYPVGHVKVTRHLSSPLIDTNTGKVLMVVGVGNKKEEYDDLDVKKLELSMRGMWDRLGEIQRNEEKVELLRSNEELQKFAYVASHDLKSPLRAIFNLATWIEEDIKENKDVSEHLNLLKNRVTRMGNLIDGLLEFSRVGRMHTEIEKVDLNKIIASIREELACGEKLSVENTLPILVINKIRITQLFTNIIHNAFKHHHNPDNAKVKVHFRTDYSFYLFCVEDNGPGIDPRYHEKIFEIFQTLKSKDDLEATGIGLSIAKKIVEDYGGKIWIESNGKEGCKFCFKIPRSYGE